MVVVVKVRPAQARGLDGDLDLALLWNRRLSIFLWISAAARPWHHRRTHQPQILGTMQDQRLDTIDGPHIRVSENCSCSLDVSRAEFVCV